MILDYLGEPNKQKMEGKTETESGEVTIEGLTGAISELNLYLLALKMEEGAIEPLDSGKGKQKDSPIEPSERIVAQLTHGF